MNTTLQTKLINIKREQTETQPAVQSATLLPDEKLKNLETRTMNIITLATIYGLAMYSL